MAELHRTNRMVRRVGAVLSASLLSASVVIGCSMSEPPKKRAAAASESSTEAAPESGSPLAPSAPEAAAAATPEPQPAVRPVRAPLQVRRQQAIEPLKSGAVKLREGSAQPIRKLDRGLPTPLDTAGEPTATGEGAQEAGDARGRRMQLRRMKVRPDATAPAESRTE